MDPLLDVTSDCPDLEDRGRMVVASQCSLALREEGIWLDVTGPGVIGHKWDTPPIAIWVPPGDQKALVGD